MRLIRGHWKPIQICALLFNPMLVTSLEQTKQLAAQFAQTLKGGELVALRGDLGTGKTTFVKGLAEALGIEEIVRSPTFTLLHVFETKHQLVRYLVHIDAYRLHEPDALTEIGIGEWLERKDAIVCLEWPDAPGIPIEPDHVVRFALGEKENEREIEINRHPSP